MKSHIFIPDDQISILDFLSTFKRPCNNLSIHYGAQMFPCAHFMTVSTKKGLLHRLEGEDDDEDDFDDEGEQCSRMLQCYVQVVNCL